MNNYNPIFNEFFNLISTIINKHAPIKPLTRKQKRLDSKPWISKQILSSICERHSLFKTHFQEGGEVEKSFYQKFSNKLTILQQKVSSKKK